MLVFWQPFIMTKIPIRAVPYGHTVISYDGTDSSLFEVCQWARDLGLAFKVELDESFNRQLGLFLTYPPCKPVCVSVLPHDHIVQNQSTGEIMVYDLITFRLKYGVRERMQFVVNIKAR